MTKASTHQIPLGIAIWQGASQLTGEAIVCLLTGIRRPSRNTKTGPMLQTWIVRQDMKPIYAVQQGKSDAVCGDCALQGNGCYVATAKAPGKAYAAWLDQKYPTYTPAFRPVLQQSYVRMGSYGDPCAVPLRIWRKLSDWSLGWTGYTHQWRRPEFQGYRDLVMASVESPSDAESAQSMGWRTFRMSATGIPMSNECGCPAPTHGVQCIDCLLCKGTSVKARSVVIQVHGRKQDVQAALRIIR